MLRSRNSYIAAVQRAGKAAQYTHSARQKAWLISAILDRDTRAFGRFHGLSSVHWGE